MFTNLFSLWRCKMKRKSIMFYTYSAIFLIIAAFFLPQLLFIRVLAKEEYKPKIYKYYTSIEIQEGDTLWSIACQYADEEFISITEYIEELRYMNQLSSDRIFEGHYLTISYYSEQYK